MSTTEPPVRSRAGLWALTATHAANDFYTGAVAALLPFFVLHAHYSYAAVAGITLAATALSSVAQPVFGDVSDRFGMRWLSLAGLLTAGIGAALSGLLSGSYLAVWIVIAISGIGVAAYHPAATMEAREAGGGTSGAMSLFSVGGNVGVALAPAAVILVVGWFGLNGTALLVIPALVLGLVYAAVSWKHLFARTASAPTPAGGTTMHGAAGDDWRAFGWLTLVLAMWSVAYVGMSTFVSLYSIERFDTTPEFASVALSVFPAAGAVGTLAGGWLADRFGRLRIVRTGYLLAAVAIAAIVLAPSPAVVIAMTAVLGVSLFIPFAAQITLSHSYLPNRIGLASGVTLGLTLSLGGFASPLLGRIADQYSVQLVFTLMAALVAVGFALSFVLRERTVAAQPVPVPHTTSHAAGQAEEVRT
ncbi:MFS transporter [Gordonia iterans]